MNFEQEYQLQEFKEIQDQYFDKTGACYTGNTIGTNIMERMLKLIDILSERSKNAETLDKHESKQLILPIVSGSASDFNLDLGKLINNYIKAGLKKPDLVKKMEWMTGNCKLS